MTTLQETVRTYLRPADEGGVQRDGCRNVSQGERLLSAAAGALLVKLGVRQRGVSGLLGAGLGAVLIHRGYTGQCAVYKRLGVSGIKPASSSAYFDHGIHVEASVTVNRSPQDLYDFWRHFQNLPRFMNHLLSVEVIDDTRSRWTAKGPMGTQVHWDAEIINDVPGETIAWRSLAGAEVDNAGSVRFLPTASGEGTVVRVNLDYIPPGRQVGKWVAKLFGEEPEQQIKEDLATFKNIMEQKTASAD